jgi:hypothetical protein
MIVLSALALIIAGGAMAGEPRGIQTAQFENTFDAYIPCLDEVTSNEVRVEVRYHVFETAAGTFHVIDNWTLHRVVTAPSGRAWLGRGVSPYQFNAKVGKGVAEQFIARLRLMPITDDTPIMLFQNQFKITVNANGDLVVLHEENPTEELFRCLPNAK